MAAVLLLLSEGEEIKTLAARKLALPPLAIGGASGDFTPNTFAQIGADETSVALDDVGQFVAVEAPDRLAATLLPFFDEVDRRP